MLEQQGKSRWAATKWVLVGLLWLGLVGMGWFTVLTSFMEEFELVRFGVSTPANIGECFEEVVESDTQGSGIITTCGYWFEADGKKYFGSPETIFDTDTIIYLPENPTVHRVKHTMGDGLLDFFFRRVGVSLLLLILFTAPSIIILKTGIIAFIKNEPASEE